MERSAYRIELDLFSAYKKMRRLLIPIKDGNEQLFASKYKLLLPNEDKLRAELDRFSNGSWVKKGKRRPFLCLIFIGGLSPSV
ncbi:hypothetical protein IQ22_04591 [Pseudomonas duriflava]|uniref:Uncharacterized protein n=1 Tax=Pseudomonas duriflava TaxID=459528 RepID=A0A562PN60_9PSED|nr:hypothetical protein [Pseudomonas duriflava]TWI45640.1 hypothetical protein IQ22_04591 [Pseudomonas duriflava]